MSSYDKQYIVKTIKKLLDETVKASGSTAKANIANSMFKFMNTYENFSDFLKEHKKFRDTLTAKTYELLADPSVKLCPELEPNLRRCQEMIYAIEGCPQEINVSYGDCPQEIIVSVSYGDCS